MRFTTGSFVWFLAIAACSDSGKHSSPALASDSVVAPAAAVAATTPPERLITATSIGGVDIGMSLDDVRKKFPSATVERTSDGEGVALVQITMAPDVSMIAYTDEEDADKPINYSKKITLIETFSPAFATAEGAHAGSLVSDVEKIYGKTLKVETSEIESRQYVTFERQPAAFTFQLDRAETSLDGPGVQSQGEIRSIAVTAPRR